MIKKLFFKLLIFVFVFNISLPLMNLPAQAAGATLFLSPGSGTYSVGKTFAVNVMVNSGGGVGINAAEGVIKYDSSLLNVTGISDGSSIFKLWTAEPNFSNAEGRISFGGGSPGAYKGNAGTVFSITFSVKKAGTANVNFTSGIVLAADGKGTNVFSGFGQGKYILEDKKEEPKPKPKPKEEKKDEPRGLLPPIPEISSPSHFDEKIWYSNNRPEFTWKVLPDLTNVSFKIDSEPGSDPGIVPEGIIETTKFDPIADGEWYFHIKYQNQNGWGKSAHKKILVDATAPESFDITVDNDGDTTNPSPKVVFKTEDKASGLLHYKLSVSGDEKIVSIGEAEKGYYQIGPLSPSKYQVTVVAFDKAGNTSSSSVSYIVDPLKAPIITSIPKIIDRKEDLIIRGTSFYPRVTIKIYISKSEKETEEYSVKTDDEGNWTYFHTEKLKRGNYQVWAKLVDERGAESFNSTVHVLTIVFPAIVEAYGWWIILILLLIIIILILYILYQKNKFIIEKTRIKSETSEMKRKLSKIFAALREEVDELIELADKKPGLSESERRVKEKLEESLDISEEFIGKEVEDIEKEIKLKEKIEDK